MGVDLNIGIRRIDSRAVVAGAPAVEQDQFSAPSGKCMDRSSTSATDQHAKQIQADLVPFQF